MNINIESIHFNTDTKLDQYINKKLKRLARYYDRIVGIDVTLKLENSGRVKDKIVEIRVRIPGDDLFAKRTNKSFERAVDAAVEILKRGLKRRKELQFAKN